MPKHTSKRGYAKRSRSSRTNKKMRRTRRKMKVGGFGDNQPLTKDNFNNSFTAIRSPARFDLYTLTYTRNGEKETMNFDYAVANSNKSMFSPKATAYSLKKYEVLLKTIQLLYVAGQNGPLKNILTASEYPNIPRKGLSEINFEINDRAVINNVKQYLIQSKGGFREFSIVNVNNAVNNDNAVNV